MSHRLANITIGLSAVVFAVIASFWAITNQRVLASLLAMLFILFAVPSFRQRRVLCIAMAVAWTALAFSPLKLSSYSAPGKFRVMRLVGATYLADGTAWPFGPNIEQGIFYGSDIVGPQAPKWVVVW